MRICEAPCSPADSAPEAARPLGRVPAGCPFARASRVRAGSSPAVARGVGETGWRGGACSPLPSKSPLTACDARKGFAGRAAAAAPLLSRIRTANASWLLRSSSAPDGAWGRGRGKARSEASAAGSGPHAVDRAGWGADPYSDGEDRLEGAASGTMWGGFGTVGRSADSATCCPPALPSQPAGSGVDSGQAFRDRPDDSARNNWLGRFSCCCGPDVSMAAGAPIATGPRTVSGSVAPLSVIPAPKQSRTSDGPDTAVGGGMGDLPRQCSGLSRSGIAADSGNESAPNELLARRAPTQSSRSATGSGASCRYEQHCRGKRRTPEESSRCSGPATAIAVWC